MRDKITLKRLAPTLIVASLVVAATVFVVPSPPKSHALSGSDFNPGRIIDDAIFENSNAMSVQDIQNFLDAKVGTCDNSGTRLSSHWDSSTNSYYTDGQWAALYGQSSTFTCINQYVENTTTLQNNYGNYTAAVPGGISAAQIIYNAAQQYQINPEVILVTLQKEQGLVTDYWPWISEYQYAMGYNCPDTGNGCSSSSADFYQQVNDAAWQFRDYYNNPSSFSYTVGTNFILYNPNASACSGTFVNIQNQATANLYNYTPYQPDSNVLNNTNPTGSNLGPGGQINDTCAAYGNRNFWWYFNTWFGTTYNNLNITYEVGDDSVNSAGDIAVVPIKLANPPLSTVVLNYTVSNPAIAKILGNASLTFNDSNWNVDQNIVVQGLSSSLGSGDFDLQVAYINSPDGAYSQGVTPYLNVLPMFWQNLSEQAVYRLYNATTGKHAYAVSANIVNLLESSGYTMESTLGDQCTGSTDTPLVVDNTLGMVRPFNSPDITNKETAQPTILYSNSNGGIYVTVLKNPGGTDTVLSSNAAEVSSLEQSGYTDVVSILLCYPGITPVYRLYDPVTGAHFYTTSTSEVSTPVTNYGFSFEGVAFYLDQTDTTPVYRLYDPTNGSHFYTISMAEAKIVEGVGYQYEGVAFNAGTRSGPVYRLYNPTSDLHFYTISMAEVNAVEQLGYKYEGIAYYLN